MSTIPTPPPPDPTAKPGSPGALYYAIGLAFTTIMAGLAVYWGIGQPAPVTPPTPPTLPTPVSTVLGSKNLSLIGYMLCPRDGDPLTRYSIPWCGQTTGLMIRKMPDGSKHFLMTSYPPAVFSPAQTTPPPANNGNSVVEITAPAGFNLDITQAPRATFVASYSMSAIYQGTVPLANPNVSGFVTPGCQAFDGVNLFTPFAGFYNVSSSDFPSIALSQLQADGTWKAFGPFFAQSGSKTVRGYCVLANGNTYFGSPITAGDSASSWGPDLVQVQTPTPTTPPAASPINPFATGMPTLACTKLLFYPYSIHPLVGDNWIGYSNKDTGTKNAFGTEIWQCLTTPTNTWAPSNGVITAGWVKTPTLEGIVFWGNKVKPGSSVWYGNPKILSPSSGSIVNAAGATIPGAADDYCNTTNPPPNIYDPDNQTRGGHACFADLSTTPPTCTSAFVGAAWFYAASDLAAVVAGTKNPWDVVPTEVFDTTNLFGPKVYVQGMCVDPVDPTIFYVNLGAIEPTSPKMTVIAAIKVQ